MEKLALLGMTKDRISEILEQYDLPRYAVAQVTDWIYKKNIFSIQQMSNLPKLTRALLEEKFVFGASAPVKYEISSDGTKKYLYSIRSGKYVETAYIPENDRATICVSTQSGCKMGCYFCKTGKQGFQGNLTAGEIINQYSSLPEKEKITNIVYMGMGEPFDNIDAVMDSLDILTAEWGFALSPRRIQVSTVGIIPAMEEFLEKSKCHLAVSLHTPFSDERKRLMPVENIYPLSEVVKTIRVYNLERQRRISFEYIMFKGLNDTPAHIKELSRLLNGLRCRINLIRFHPVPGIQLETSDDKTIESFMIALNAKGIRTTVRKSRGVDISAACGLLSTKEMQSSNIPEY